MKYCKLDIETIYTLIDELEDDYKNLNNDLDNYDTRSVAEDLLRLINKLYFSVANCWEE